MLSQYVPLLWLLGLTGAVVGGILTATTLLGPKKPSKIKNAAFECGSEAIGDTRQRFSVKFYMVAITFIVFDVEAVFVIPWAVVSKSLGWAGFGAMGVFLVILTLGLVYEWGSGGLEWD
jgi:NADH-quinone oxidoreductase subunit A